MINVVIDTNALVSLIDESDKWNKATDEILNYLLKSDVNIVILDIVINEAINVLAKRFESKNKLNEFPELILKIETKYPVDNIIWISKNIDIYHCDIINMLKKYTGFLNYNDCFIIKFMIETKIKHIISYDTDFDKINLIKRLSLCSMEL